MKNTLSLVVLMGKLILFFELFIIFSSLYLWSTTRKKPVCVLRQAHGYHCTSQSTMQLTQQQKDTLQAESQSNPQASGEARWITAVAAMPYTDLVASGSSDGFLRLWRVSQDWKSLSPVDRFPIVTLIF